MGDPAKQQHGEVAVASLKCPGPKGKPCGKDYSFRVAVGPGPRRGVPRLYMECTSCGHKTSFVLADSIVDLNSGKAAGPLDNSGAPIRVML